MEGSFWGARAREPSTDVAAVPLVLVEGPRCEGVLYRCCYSCWCCVLTSLRVFVVEAVLSLLVFAWVFLFLCFFLCLFRFLCVCSLASVFCHCCWCCCFCCCCGCCDFLVVLLVVLWLL